jgi:hypothetical protein
LLSATISRDTGFIHAIVCREALIESLECGCISSRDTIEAPLEAGHIIGSAPLSTSEDSTTREAARLRCCTTSATAAEASDHLSLTNHVHALEIVLPTLTTADRVIEAV